MSKTASLPKKPDPRWKLYGAGVALIYAFYRVAIDPSTGDAVLVVVTLNPFSPEEATLWLDMPALGMEWHERFWVRDEVTGEEYHWGQANYVRLDPAKNVAHIVNLPRVPEAARTLLLRRE